MMLRRFALLALLLTVSFARGNDAPATTAPATPIVLTPAAAKEVKAIISAQELDVAKVYLQVGVKGDSEGGFSYLLDLNEEAGAKEDLRFESHGVRIRVDQKSDLYLRGTTIDFRDGEEGRGFVFRNPNAKSDGESAKK